MKLIFFFARRPAGGFYNTAKKKRKTSYYTISFFVKSLSRLIILMRIIVRHIKGTHRDMLHLPSVRNRRFQTNRRLDDLYQKASSFSFTFLLFSFACFLHHFLFFLAPPPRLLLPPAPPVPTTKRKKIKHFINRAFYYGKKEKDMERMERKKMETGLQKKTKCQLSFALPPLQESVLIKVFQQVWLDHTNGRTLL